MKQDESTKDQKWTRKGKVYKTKYLSALRELWGDADTDGASRGNDLEKLDSQNKTDS